MRIFGKGSSKSFFSEEPMIKGLKGGRKKGGFRIKADPPPGSPAPGYHDGLPQEELSADQVLRGARRRRGR